MKNTTKFRFFTYKKLIFSLLIFSYIHYNLQAQVSQSSLDSLQQALKQTNKEQEKVDIYNEITNFYLQKSDSANTLYYFQSAYDLSKKHNYQEGLSLAHLTVADLYFNKNINDSLSLHHLHEGLYVAKQAQKFDLQARAYKRMGSIYRRKGNYSLSLQNHQLALQIYQNLKDPKGIAGVQNNIGNLYNDVGNLALALDYLLKSLKYWENNNELRLIGIISNNIGIIHMKQEDTDRALSYFFKALEIMQSLDNQAQIASISNNLGIIFNKLKNHEKARFYYQKALNIHQNLDNTYGIGLVLNNLGESYKTTGDYQKALGYLEQALEIRKQLNTEAGIASTLIEMGAVYHHLKNDEKAESFLIQGKERAQRIGLSDEVKIALNFLAELYYHQKQYEKAYQARTLFSQLSDSLLNAKTIRQTTLMDANYRFQQQTDSLRQVQDKEKIELKASQLNQFWWITLLTLSSIVLIFIILILISRQKGRRKHLDQAIELQNIKHQLLQEQLQRKEIEEKVLQEQLLNSEDKDFELTRQALHLVQNQQLFDKISEEIKEIIKSGNKLNQSRLKGLIKIIHKETNTTEEWQNFTQIFEMAHPHFFHRLQQSFPELTDKDLRVAALLRLGFDSNELALILNINPDSVRRARSRIRKKIGLHEGKLSEFMRKF